MLKDTKFNEHIFGSNHFKLGGQTEIKLRLNTGIGVIQNQVLTMVSRPFVELLTNS